MTEAKTAPLHWSGSFNDLMDKLGGLTDDEFKDGFMHLGDVALKNQDVVALGILTQTLEQCSFRPAARSLKMLLTEAMAVGKEITLRKLCKEFDPHGEWIDIPKDWIGNGPGPA